MMSGFQAMSKADFLARFGDIFEHSPWIAARVWEQGIERESAQALYAAFSQTILEADRQQQLALLQAHPPLACGIGGNAELTAASREEQRGAGLDQCSAEEFEQFRRLNASYTEKFGFPFIMAVKGISRRVILERFRSRLQNTAEEEFQRALEQVIRIGRYRFRDACAGLGN
jgi:OHCU decarboxylase